MDSQSIPLKPERLIELEEYAQMHGQTPADALDYLLAEQLKSEKRAYEDTVKAALRGYEDVKAGRTRPAEQVYESLRAKQGL